MKNKILFPISCAIAFLFAGCSNDDYNYIKDKDYVIEQNSSVFAVYPLALQVPAEGGTFELKVTGSDNWTATLVNSNSLAQNWCTIDKSSGSGTDVIKVAVTQSGSFVKNRQVVIAVSNGTKTLKSKVMQATLVLGEDEVLINGLIWSTKNVGAPGTFVSDIDAVGELYQFNRKVGFPYQKSVPEFASAFTNYSPSEDGFIANAWSLDNDPCPQGWRVPTGQEVVDLMGDSQAHLKVVWVNPTPANGFARIGFVAGISDATVAAGATKANIKALGGIFLPQSGWLSENGALDRDWLVTLRTATSLNKAKGGMFLSGFGYTDAWGWGDGDKNRAAMVRCVKIISLED